MIIIVVVNTFPTREKLSGPLFVPSGNKRGPDRVGVALFISKINLPYLKSYNKYKSVILSFASQ